MILADLAELVKKDYSARQVINELGDPRAKVWVGGVSFGLSALLFALLQKETQQFIFIATSTLLEAERIYSDLRNFMPEDDLELLHPLDAYPHEPTAPSLDLQGQRIGALQRVLERQVKVLIAPVKAFIFNLANRELVKNKTINFKVGEGINLDKLSKNLVEIGYQRVSLVGEKGEFAVRGGIVDIFSPNENIPYRIELDGEKIASIRKVEIISQRSVEKNKRSTRYFS